MASEGASYAFRRMAGSFPPAVSFDSQGLRVKGGESGSGMMTASQEQRSFDFDGATFDRELDSERLSTALGRVYLLMQDGRWRSLREIAAASECSEAGASARLRDLRKDRFQEDFPNGGIEKQRIAGGLYVYRMIF